MGDLRARFPARAKLLLFFRLIVFLFVFSCSVAASKGPKIGIGIIISTVLRKRSAVEKRAAFLFRVVSGDRM